MEAPSQLSLKGYTLLNEHWRRKETPDQPPQVIFTSQGDLELVVRFHNDGQYHSDKHESAIWHVCSKTLAAVSPVFKSMLYGGFAESKPKSGPWKVEIHGDDYHCLLIVMHAVHGNKTHVPKDLHSCECDCYDLSTIEHLYNIVRIVDKYDMVEVLRPWANAWLHETTATVGTTEDLNELTTPWFGGWYIWIAWVLGDEVLLNHQIDQIWLNTFIGETVPESDPVRWRSGDRYRRTSKEEKEYEHSVKGLKNENSPFESALYRPGGEMNFIFWSLAVAVDISFRRLFEVMRFLPVMKPLIAALNANVDAGHFGPGAPGLNKVVKWILRKHFGDVETGVPSKGLPVESADSYDGTMAELYQALDELEECVLQESKYFRDLHMKDIMELKKLRSDGLGCHAVKLAYRQRAHLKRQREKSGIRLRADTKTPAKDLPASWWADLAKQCGLV